MLKYSYQALSESGEIVRGTMEASTLAEAMLHLQASGLEVRSIALFEAETHPAETQFAETQHSETDPQGFHRWLSATLSERERWVPAVRAMVEELPPGAVRRETAQLVHRLEQNIAPEQFLSGRESAAMLPLLTSASDAGQSNERLRDWLNEMVRVQQARIHRRRRLVYPVCLLILTTGILMGFSFYLIPVFREMFSSTGLRLATPTRWTFWVADQLSHFLPRTVLLLSLFGCLFVWLMRFWRKRALTNRLLGKFVAGSSGNLRSMSTLTSTLAELLALNCPLPYALKIAGRASHHHYYARAADELSQAVSQALPLQALERVTALPPSVIHALTCGENQRPCVPLLRELATIYAHRAATRQDFLTGSLPAIGVMLLGLAVGFVVVSLFMPLVSMVNSLS